jgi:hypothetical protein
MAEDTNANTKTPPVSTPPAPTGATPQDPPSVPDANQTTDITPTSPITPPPLAPTASTEDDLTTDEVKTARAIIDKMVKRSVAIRDKSSHDNLSYQDHRNLAAKLEEAAKTMELAAARLF